MGFPGFQPVTRCQSALGARAILAKLSALSPALAPRIHKPCSDSQGPSVLVQPSNRSWTSSGTRPIVTMRGIGGDRFRNRYKIPGQQPMDQESKQNDNRYCYRSNNQDKSHTKNETKTRTKTNRRTCSSNLPSTGTRQQETSTCLVTWSLPCSRSTSP